MHTVYLHKKSVYSHKKLGSFTDTGLASPPDIFIWQRRGIDIFAETDQTAGYGIYDFFGWAVMSLAYWYDICLEENPEVIFRIERPDDDDLLSGIAGHPVTRDGKNLWHNEHSAGKKSPKLEYPISELARVPKYHLSKLVDVTARLGYPEDADTLAGYL